MYGIPIFVEQKMLAILSLDEFLRYNNKNKNNIIYFQDRDANGACHIGYEHTKTETET